MKIDAILFDVNGTLIDILTNEDNMDVYRGMRNFFHYIGINVHKTQLKNLYFQIMKEQRETSREKYPEFDATGIWQKILDIHQNEHTQELAPETLHSLPKLLAQFYRTCTLQKKLKTYPGVHATLEELHKNYRMAVVTDGQSAYALNELRAVELDHFFSPVIVSGYFGYRKPDPRIYLKALITLGVQPENAIYVGNDMYRDVWGPKQLGMKVVYFNSNQGDKQSKGSEPDYVIYQFPELIAAVNFLKNQP